MGDDNAQGSAPELVQQASSSGSQSKQKKKKEYTRLEPTTPEQLAQEDLMNNCAVKTVVSGVMGSVLGAAFGVFMGAMDTAVRPVLGLAWALSMPCIFVFACSYVAKLCFCCIRVSVFKWQALYCMAS